MKIYFEDGPLVNPHLYNMDYVKIDAGFGFTYCTNLLWECDDKKVEAIYTNCIDCLSTYFSWNSKTNSPDIFLRHPQTMEWTAIDKFYSGLRISQNVPAMYRSNCFKTIEKEN